MVRDVLWGVVGQGGHKPVADGLAALARNGRERAETRGIVRGLLLLLHAEAVLGLERLLQLLQLLAEVKDARLQLVDLGLVRAAQRIHRTVKLAQGGRSPESRAANIVHVLSCAVPLPVLLSFPHSHTSTHVRSFTVKSRRRKKHDTEEQLGFLWFLSSQEGRSRSPDVVQMTQDSRHRISAPLLMTKQKSFGRF